jgi:formylglycine-generating enzyme required for sulfatase activity
MLGKRAVAEQRQDMVEVPGGEVFMGCNEEVDSECDDDEKPGRRVNAGPFRIDRTEVTVAAYGRKYPWGNGWDESRANVRGNGTRPVGSYPAGVSPYGALGMAGNVWEWTADCSKSDCAARVLRGGSWSVEPQVARASDRDGGGLRLQGSGGGFRCAR